MNFFHKQKTTSRLVKLRVFEIKRLKKALGRFCHQTEEAGMPSSVCASPSLRLFPTIYTVLKNSTFRLHKLRFFCVNHQIAIAGVLSTKHVLKLRHGRRKNSVDRKKRKFLGTTRGRTGSRRKAI